MIDVETVDVLENMGAKYVMTLDYGHLSYYRTWQDYYPEDLVGIIATDEDTPGFDPTLSGGDLHLFYITDTE